MWKMAAEHDEGLLWVASRLYDIAAGNIRSSLHNGHWPLNLNMGNMRPVAEIVGERSSVRFSAESDCCATWVDCPLCALKRVLPLKHFHK